MKIRFINNTLRNKKYDYSPMYYDERKERLEAKRKQFERMERGEMSDEERRELLRQSMQRQWTQSDYRRKARTKSNMRIVLLVAVILILGYFVFNGMEDIEKIVNRLM